MLLLLAIEKKISFFQNWTEQAISYKYGFSIFDYFECKPVKQIFCLAM